MPAASEGTSPPRAAELIHELAEAFQQSQVLFFANAAGLFPFLEFPRTVDETAKQFSWSTHGTRMVLEAVCGLGLAVQDGDTYRNTPAASRALVPGGTEYQGGYVRHMARAAEHWMHLDACVRTGHGVRAGRPPASSPEGEDYAAALTELGACNAPALAAAVDFSPFHHVLELGGGPGEYTTALLEAYPNLHITIMDSPAMLTLARMRTGTAGVADRCRFLAGDFLVDDLGGGYDALLLSNVLHGLPTAVCPALFRRCYRALTPGGALLVRDFIRGTGQEDPLFTRLFSLHMLVHTEGGDTPCLPALTAWAAHAGFLPGACVALGRKSRLFRAVRPR